LRVEEDLVHFVNDALMALFFFVVGLELKREIVTGELADRRVAALPVCAAIGGMLVPAGIYALIALGGPASNGWGIPMATDIAFALAVLAVLGSRVPPALKLFLLTLAVVDDIGAIIVIAIVYSHGFHLDAALLALALVLMVVVLRLLGVRPIPIYVAVAAGLWLALYQSGLHATIAGVVLGLLAPTTSIRRQEYVSEEKLRDVSTPEAAHETVVLARESVSVVSWLEHLLHPWTSFVIVPLFALANAGVPLSSSALSAAASSPIAYGVLLGLVVGKVVGISAFSWLAVRLRVGLLPDGVRWSGIVGVGLIAGIGFTVSIFVTGLAFDDVALQDEAKIAILFAAVIASVAGAFVVMRSARSSRPPGSAR
jgi:NhaA family Na+:H+ antiporter